MLLKHFFICVYDPSALYQAMKVFRKNHEKINSGKTHRVKELLKIQLLHHFRVLSGSFFMLFLSRRIFLKPLPLNKTVGKLSTVLSFAKMHTWKP